MKNPYIDEMITALLAIVLGILCPILVGDGTISLIIIPIGILILVNAIREYRAEAKAKNSNHLKGGKAA